MDGPPFITSTTLFQRDNEIEEWAEGQLKAKKLAYSHIFRVEYKQITQDPSRQWIEIVYAVEDIASPCFTTIEYKEWEKFRNRDRPKMLFKSRFSKRQIDINTIR